MMSKLKDPPWKSKRDSSWMTTGNDMFVTSLIRRLYENKKVVLSKGAEILFTVVKKTPRIQFSIQHYNRQFTNFLAVDPDIC